MSSKLPGLLGLSTPVVEPLSGLTPSGPEGGLAHPRPDQFHRGGPTTRVRPRASPAPASEKPGLGVKAGVLALAPGQGLGLADLFTVPAADRDHGRSRAQAALGNSAPPRPDHPLVLHTQHVRERLAAEGLPTSAGGVEIHVLGEDARHPNPKAREHGPQVARAVAGPTGLGQGAEVFLPDPVRPPSAPEAAVRAQALRAGTLDLKDTLQLGVDRLVEPVDTARVELQSLRERVPADGKTRIANMSWGQSIQRVGTELAETAWADGRETPLLRDVNEALKRDGHPPIKTSDPRGRAKLEAYMVHALQQEVSSGPSKARIDAAKSALGDEVAQSRAAGILPIVAVGNEGNQKLLDAVPPEHRASLVPRFRDTIDDVPGLLMVGGSDIGKPGDPSDDRLYHRTNFGAHLIAPGENVPVAAPGPFGGTHARDVDGTSFSAPYVAGVAGLMLTANPKLGVDQLESILRDPRVLRDLPGEQRDGGGILDEVAAVRMARDLRP